MKNARRGSVMMELVVVLPIYLVLFGGVFMLGDMLIRSIRLPSAERTRAFDLGRSDGNEPGWEKVTNALFHPGKEVSDNKQDTDQLTKEKENSYYADTAIDGPFSVRTAAKVRNDYALLAGGSRVQMAFAHWLFQNRLQHDPVDDVEQDVPKLYSGGRMKMYSKPETKPDGKARTYTYNYYTLKRHRYANLEITWRDNRRHAHELLTKFSGTRRVWKAVELEAWHGSITDALSNDKAMKKPNDSVDEQLVEYQRYGAFVTWSN